MIEKKQHNNVECGLSIVHMIVEEVADMAAFFVLDIENLKG